MNNREIAMHNGDVTYNTGKPCRKGHTTDRYTSNGVCLGCMAQRVQMYKDARKAPPVDRATVQQLCDILQHAPPRVVAILKEHISDIHADPNTYK